MNPGNLQLGNVFPARGGVIRPARIICGMPCGFPRTRGGDPANKAVKANGF